MSDQPPAEPPEDLTLLVRSLLVKQQKQLLDEMGAMRDDMRVLLAVTQRIDGTIQGLVNELRALHSQQSRMDRRLRELESQPQPEPPDPAA